MTRSNTSRKGYRPTQKAGHDSPWRRNDFKRKRKLADEDLRDAPGGGQ